MPYKSDAQRKLFHAMEDRGEISHATVKHWDEASKGKKLPEHVSKKKTTEKKAVAPLAAGAAAIGARILPLLGRAAPAVKAVGTAIKNNPNAAMFGASMLPGLLGGGGGGGAAGGPAGSGYGTPGVPMFKNVAPKPHSFMPVKAGAEKKAAFVRSFKTAFYAKLGTAKQASIDILEKLANNAGAAGLMISGKGLSPEAAKALGDSMHGQRAASPDATEVFKELGVAAGPSFAVGSLAGAGLAKLLGPSNEDVDVLKKKELLAHYENAIAAVQRRMLARSGK